MAISLCVIIAGFLCSFFSIRLLFLDIINYLMNKNAVKKRKKNMTFKEWFTYSRFRTEIPHYHIVIYYVIIAVYDALFILTVIIYSTNYDSNSMFNSYLYRLICAGFTVVIIVGYRIALEGYHLNYNRLMMEGKLRLRGIDKKAYREKMKKLRAQEEKEKRKKENADNKGKK